MTAEPMTERKQKTAEKKMVPRRPKKLLRGSEAQQPLNVEVSFSRGYSTTLGTVCLQKSGANVGSSVYNADNPRVQAIVDAWYRASLGRFVGDIEVNGPGQIGTIRTSLIPTLYSGTNGAKNDGEVERAGLAPFVENFIAKGIAFDFIQLGDLLESRRILGHQSTFLQQRDHILHARRLGKLLDIVKESITRNASQRVLNSVGLTMRTSWLGGESEEETYRAVTLRFKLTDC